MTCLLIDDDLDDQEIFSIALAEVDSDIKLITCCDALEAIKFLVRKDLALPQYIFLDINMPRIDGWHCLRQINTLLHLRDVPVIIYSTSETLSEIYDENAFTAFLPKQTKVTDLVAKLEELFEKNKAKSNAR